MGFRQNNMKESGNGVSIFKSFWMCRGKGEKRGGFVAGHGKKKIT